MYDTLNNTGLWKMLVVEICINLIMPYPFMNDYLYFETYDTKGGHSIIEFRVSYFIKY